MVTVVDYYDAIASAGPDPTAAMQHLQRLAGWMDDQRLQQGRARRDTLHVHRPAFNQALDPKGLAGAALDAKLLQHFAIHNGHEDAYADGATAAMNAHGILAQYGFWRTNLAAQGADECAAAAQQGGQAGAAAAAAEVTYWRGRVTELWGSHAKDVATALGGKFTPPLAPTPGKDDHKKDGKKGDEPLKRTGVPGHDPADGSITNTVSDEPVKRTDLPTASEPSLTTSAPASPIPSMPASPLGGGSSGGGSGGGVGSGLGSNPFSSLHQMAMTPLSAMTPASTSAASTTPPVPQTPASGGLPNALGAFQSGLSSTSGVSGAPVATGASSALPATGASPYTQPLAPFAAQQPAVASPPAVGGGGAPVTVGPVAAPVDAGHAGAGAPMMAAPVAAGGQLAPYSMPGAGTPPLSMGTAPATSFSSGSSQPSSAVPSAGGAPPLVASAGGSAASASVAAASEDPNPHIIAARRVLEGLVRGTEASRLRSPVMWAVALVEAASVQHIVVASSAGDGGYLPGTVYLPVGARLAVADPVLPRGWAGERFLGWQHPTSVIEAHYEALQDAPIYGPRVLATVTNELWPRRPRCGGAFLALTDREILLRAGSAPQLDAAHCHRLSVFDPQLAARLAAAVQMVPADRRAERYRDLSVAITDQVLAAAAESDDDTGERLTLAADEKLWAAVRSGKVTDEGWRAWSEESDTGRDLPEIHAPQDLDESPTSRSMRRWYLHHYRSARLAEMLSCWRPNGVGLGLLDVAYCASAAGFPEQIATAITEVNS